jgi:hypothetical protein
MRENAVRIPSKSFACIMLTAVMTLFLALGCGKKQPSVTPAPTTSVPLPEWAPKHPSPEFLRAARVLKPLPMDLLQRKGEAIGLSDEMLKRYTRWWAAGYELFGTFGDEQVGRFRENGTLRLHVRDLTAKQRQAFEAFMDAKDKALAGTDVSEYRILLYKFGAQKDLSNVDVGFEVEAHVVMVRTWIPNPQAPEKSTTIGDAFATM